MDRRKTRWLEMTPEQRTAATEKWRAAGREAVRRKKPGRMNPGEHERRSAAVRKVYAGKTPEELARWRASISLALGDTGKPKPEPVPRAVPDPAVLAEIRRQYEAGTSVRAIAGSAGLSGYVVTRVLRDAGVTIRPYGRGGSNTGKGVPKPAAQRAAISRSQRERIARMTDAEWRAQRDLRREARDRRPEVIARRAEAARREAARLETLRERERVLQAKIELIRREALAEPREPALRIARRLMEKTEWGERNITRRVKEIRDGAA